MKTEKLNFETLTQKELLEISAGGSCLNKIGAGVVKGIFAGGAAGAAATMGLGTAGGAFVGAHIGAAAGAITCLGE
ncbi:MULTISPECIES: Blp family class II bacteriocin [unclassified Bacillus (in: firmicutes)]|uniref:Blp family class II bacteriocin n=1 Tax=unclassified Bacillus (in: firmicutes) TaxID=185979 RepID=UPI0030FB6EC4